MSTQKVLQEVADERTRQDTKHGGPANDDRNTESDWHRWIIEHLGMSSRDEHTGKRQEMIRVAALAIAAVEAFDRFEYREHLYKLGHPAPEEEEIPL